MKLDLLTKALVSVSGLALCLSGGAVSAQEAPIPNPKSSVDDNGVDLATGDVSIKAVEASIDAPDGVLAESFFKGAGYASTHNVYLIDNFDTKQVVFGNSRSDYEPDGTNRWIAANGDGGVLTYVPAGGSNPVGYYLLDQGNGTAIEFRTSSQHDVCGEENIFTPCATAPYDILLATKIEEASGRLTEMQFGTGSVCQEDINNYCIITLSLDRLERVKTNDGREIRFLYHSNDEPNAGQGNGTTAPDWLTLATVQSVNLASSYCNPYPAQCTGPSVRTTSYLNSGSTVRYHGALDTVYTKNPSGRLVGVRLPGYSSDTLTYSYGTSNRVAQVTNRGVLTTYSFIDNYSADEFTAVRTTGGLSETFVFNYDQDLLRSEGPDGIEYIYAYDSDKRLISILREDGLKQEIDYDERGNVLERLLRPSTGSPLAPLAKSADFPADCTVAVTCNSPIREENALGNATSYTWDSGHGGLLSAQLPSPVSGQPRPTVVNTYSTLYAKEKNSSGVLVPVSVGRVMLIQTRQCLVAETCPGSADERVTTYEYNHPNLALTKVTTSAGDGSVSQSVEYGYDLRLNVQYVDGALTGSTDRVTYFYDLFDRVIGIVYPDPDGTGPLPRPATRYTYDAGGRPLLVEEGGATGVTMNAVNAMTVYRATENTFDGHGRLAIQRSKAGGTTYALTQTSYDTLGRVECVAQRMNPTTYAGLPGSACTPATPGAFGEDRISRRVYGSDGKIAEMRSAVGTALEQTTVAYAYNTSGTLASVTDAGGNKTSYEYDGFDRRTKTIYPSTTTPGLSNAGDYELLTFDAASRITARRNRRGETLTYTYDNLDRLTSKQVPARPGLAATHRRPVFFSYDLIGNLTTARFDSASGEGIDLAHDALGRLLSSQQELDGQLRTVGHQYDQQGNRTRITHPDGQYWQFAYDKLARPITIKEGTSVIGTMTYGAEGGLAERRWPSATHDTTVDFGRDPLGRLVSLDMDLAGTATDLSLDYVYNPAHQIIEDTQDNQAYVWDGQVVLERNYTANGLNQYQAAGPAVFCYDATGNLTADGSNVYLYDVENRLVEKRAQTNSDCAALNYTGTLLAGLRYDPLGRLYETTGLSGTTRYLYDGLDLIGEYSSTGTLLRRYVHGTNVTLDDPLLWYEGGAVGAASRRLLLADHLGSVHGVTNYQGTSLAQNAYDEFGIPGSSNIGRFQFTGQIMLNDAGLYYFKARAYSPTLGRFLQPDPIGYGDGMNLYGYVGNDPVNKIDPFGLTEIVVNGRREPEQDRDEIAYILRGFHSMWNEQLPEHTPRTVADLPQSDGPCPTPPANRPIGNRGVVGAALTVGPTAFATAYAVRQAAWAAQAELFPGMRGVDDRADAYRHFVGSFMLARAIGPDRAMTILNANEVTNGKTAAAINMDTYNNWVGVALAGRSGLSVEEASELALNNGCLQEGL